eukprot:m.19062 g.19062  ORF g.19062 m.19062 type:complete len:226 (-) comp7973_c0_seq1:285-962(-)
MDGFVTSQQRVGQHMVASYEGACYVANHQEQPEQMATDMVMHGLEGLHVGIYQEQAQFTSQHEQPLPTYHPQQPFQDERQTQFQLHNQSQQSSQYQAQHQTQNQPQYQPLQPTTVCNSNHALDSLDQRFVQSCHVTTDSSSFQSHQRASTEQAIDFHGFDTLHISAMPSSCRQEQPQGVIWADGGMHFLATETEADSNTSELSFLMERTEIHPGRADHAMFSYIS